MPQVLVELPSNVVEYHNRIRRYQLQNKSDEAIQVAVDLYYYTRNKFLINYLKSIDPEYKTGRVIETLFNNDHRKTNRSIVVKVHYTNTDPDNYFEDTI
jgi:hypothetical protein